MSEQIKRAAVLLGAPLVFGVIGLAVPMMFDRDVGGALAASLFGVIGLVAGGVVGAIMIRRRID